MLGDNSFPMNRPADPERARFAFGAWTFPRNVLYGLGLIALAGCGGSDARHTPSEPAVGPAPIAIVTVTPPNPTLTSIGATMQLSAVAKDLSGNVLNGRAVTWTSSNTSIVTVTNDGIVAAIAKGHAVVTATSEGRSGSAAITVVTGPLVILGVSTDTLYSGAPATIVVDNVPGGSEAVSVGGVTASLTASTDTSISITVPDLGCAQPGPTSITVTVGSATASFSTQAVPSHVTTLTPGGIETEPTGASCIVLGSTSGAYYLLAYNVAPSPGTGTPVEFSGSVVGATSAITADIGLADRRVAPMPGLSAREWSQRAQLAAMAAAEASHHKDDSVLIASLPRRSQSASMATGLGVPDGLDLTVGGISTVRWNATPDCRTFESITGRTVYSGSHIVIVEDASNPLAGTQNSFLTWLGGEFDTRMYPLQQQNFGDVFARDVAGIGKVLAVVTHRVNDDGAAGLASGCNFWPRSTLAASNEMPTAYINAPLTGPDSSSWQTYTAGTLMHEVFHNVHFSERLSQTEGIQAYETTMMSEGTADYAMMIYFRARCGWTPQTNLGFAALRDCESREAAAGHPITVLSLFADIDGFLANIETKSPIADGYWISQFFLQASIENAGANEAATIKSYVRDVSATGIDNFTRHVGRSFDLLVGEYAVGILTDGLPALPTTGPYQLASWNIRDIYAAGSDTGSPRRFPARIHELQEGKTSLAIPSVAAGTTTVLELRPATTASATLRVTSQSLPLPSNMRLAVVRIQ